MSSDLTLFLDEIAEVPPAMQAKLLRVLQEQELERVGDTRTRTVKKLERIHPATVEFPRCANAATTSRPLSLISRN